MMRVVASRVCAVIFSLVGLASSGQNLTEEEMLRVWPDSGRFGGIMQSISHGADPDYMRGLLDQLTPDQQEFLIGPIQVAGHRYSPLQIAISSYHFADGELEEGKTKAALDFIDDMIRRAQSDQARGLWLATKSRTTLLGLGDAAAAIDAALQARALGAELCDGACGQTMEAWLNGEPISIGDRSAAGDVFDPRPANCEAIQSTLATKMDSGHYSDEWLLALLSRDKENALPELQAWWKRLHHGCNPEYSYSVMQEIDSAHPALLIEQSFASAQAQATSAPATIEFLGLELPLPAKECDFRRAVDCSITQPLRQQTARVLAAQLRSTSARLQPIADCLPGAERAASTSPDALKHAYETAIAEAQKLSPSDAIRRVELLLVDGRLQPLGDDRATHDLRKLLINLAYAGESARALNLWQQLLPQLDVLRTGDQQLTAKLLVLNRRVAEAESQLRGLAERGTDLDVAANWMLTRAAQEGALLRQAKFVSSTPLRSFIDGQSWASASPNVMLSSEDLIFATRPAREALDKIIESAWADVIKPTRHRQNLGLALKTAYPGDSLWTEFARASATLSAEPTGFQFAGHSLPLPKEICGTSKDSCEPTNAENLRRLLVHRGVLPAR